VERIMYNKYLKIIFRNILKSKNHSMLSILGLAIGLACCVIIMLYVQNEVSYDRYHKNSDRIFRMTHHFSSPESGYDAHFARCSTVEWFREIPKEIPEIKEMVRFSFQKRVVEAGEKKFFEDRFFVVDSNVFNVFSFQLIYGNPQTALKEPNSIVITESIAKKYFGNENPVGKVLTTIFRENSTKFPYRVTGVMQDIPKLSHFQIDFLASFSEDTKQTGWFYTYLLLNDGNSKPAVENKLSALMEKYYGKEDAKGVSLPLQKLTDIHLYSNLDREIEQNGNIVNVYIFSIVAILTLLIACVNFMNLSIAGWTKRLKEIGVRKVLGVSRNEMRIYVLLESLIFNVFGFILAFILIEFLLPFVNSMIGTNLSLVSGLSYQTILILLLMIISSSVISSIYPSYYLSGLNPISIFRMKSDYKSKRKIKFPLREVLIILQFAISIALIICTLVINAQMTFVQKKNLGLNKEQTIVIKDISRPIQDKYYALKNEFIKHSEISFVSASMDEPSKQILDAAPIEINGVLTDPQKPKFLTVLPVDENFISGMGISLLSGRNFSGYNPEKPTPEYIVNESAVNFMGWNINDVIDKKIRPILSVPPAFQPKEGSIIGIVKDFHFASLRNKIQPMVLFVQPTFLFCILIKVHDNNQIAAALNDIKADWNKILPDYPFQYTFLDDLFAGIYASDERQALVIGLFSLIAIFISCLGLFALTSFIIERRTKEIGIRKVLGSSIPEIMILLSKNFMKWVIISNIIAWPVAFYFIKKWLEDFAYRIDLNIWYFVVSAIVVMVIVLLTISIQTIKAARANPINALKYE
jgi:putative ABC transport system permease protein